MIWVYAIALAAIVFVIAAFAFRIPRAGWSLVLAALMLGLAGYSTQARPDMPAAPKSSSARDIGEAGWQMVELRKQFVSENRASSSAGLITADGFARNGQFENASILLGGVVEQNPNDYEAWLALANALVEHSEGNLTPAAIFAYRKASAIAPAEPGAPVFMGFAMVREGRLIEAHRLWSETLAAAPQDAPWRAFLAQRIALLEQLMRQIVQSNGQDSE